MRSARTASASTHPTASRPACWRARRKSRHLDKQLKAQALIAEQARTALVRAEAAYTDASQRLVSARREGAETRGKAHELQVEALRLTQLAEQTRARSEQIAADLAEVDAQLEDLQERRVTAEARFEELDMQLADSQERHAQLDDKVIEAERALNRRANSSAAWSAAPRKPPSPCAACRRARASCSARWKPRPRRKSRWPTKSSVPPKNSPA